MPWSTRSSLRSSLESAPRCRNFSLRASIRSPSRGSSTLAPAPPLGSLPSCRGGELCRAARRAWSGRTYRGSLEPSPPGESPHRSSSFSGCPVRRRPRRLSFSTSRWSLPRFSRTRCSGKPSEGGRGSRSLPSRPAAPSSPSTRPRGGGCRPARSLSLRPLALWGLDNNLTRQISLRDPKLYTTVKGLVAGGFSLGLAAGLGRPLPSISAALAALAVGAVCYGASSALRPRAAQPGDRPNWSRVRGGPVCRSDPVGRPVSRGPARRVLRRRRPDGSRPCASPAGEARPPARSRADRPHPRPRSRRAPRPSAPGDDGRTVAAYPRSYARDAGPLPPTCPR